MFEDFKQLFKECWIMISLTNKKRKLIDDWNTAIVQSKLFGRFPVLDYTMHSRIQYNAPEKMIDVDYDGIDARPTKTYRMTEEFMTFFYRLSTMKRPNSVAV